MRKTLLAVLAFGLLFFSAMAAADTLTPGSSYMAAVVCTKLDAMKSLVNALNANAKKAAETLISDPEFPCWLYSQARVPFFPVKVAKLELVMGPRTIYSGTLLIDGSTVFVFNVPDHKALEKATGRPV